MTVGGRSFAIPLLPLRQLRSQCPPCLSSLSPNFTPVLTDVESLPNGVQFRERSVGQSIRRRLHGSPTPQGQQTQAHRHRHHETEQQPGQNCHHDVHPRRRCKRWMSRSLPAIRGAARGWPCALAHCRAASSMAPSRLGGRSGSASRRRIRWRVRQTTNQPPSSPPTRPRRRASSRFTMTLTHRNAG